MDTVRVLVGEKRYVTLYTMEEVDKRISEINVSTGTTLPTASATYRGTLFTLQGSSGVSDKIYVCLKNADGSYVWKDLLTFRFAP